MSIAVRAVLRGLCLLPALLACGVLHAEVLDWDDVAWPDTSLSQTYSVGAGDVTLTFSGDAGALVAGSPRLGQSPTGGLSPAENVLVVNPNFSSGSSFEIPIEIEFSHGGGVSDVTFSLFDIDASANPNDFIDEVRVVATDGFNSFSPSSVTLGNPSQGIGNAQIAADTVRGVSSVANNLPDGNATFTFNQSRIRSITVFVRYPGPASDPASQLLGLHDITFTPQPGGSSTSASLPASDPDFEDSGLMGKVFDDRDGDGWQDEGEHGIPGVRLATARGLVVETDAHGRYHLQGLDGGLADRGRNVILKLDPATLPVGTRILSENPRVQRITQGAAYRVDFAVRLPYQDTSCCRVTETKLGEIHFSADSDALWPEFLPVLGQLAERLKRQGGGTLIIEGLSETRTREVWDELRRLLGPTMVGRVDMRRETRGARRPPAPADCSADQCRQSDGYDVEVLTHEGRLPRLAIDSEANDATRVDLSGRFMLVLPQGGSLWATEDPTAVTPRLALLGPEEVAIADGRIARSAAFYFSTNYAAFVQHAELLFYAHDDSDRIDPVDRLPVDLRTFGRVDWAGALRPELAAGDELHYTLRVYDGEGRYDETRMQSLHLVPAAARRGGPVPQRLDRPGSIAADRDPLEGTPLDGNVVVLRPPASVTRTRTETQSYTLRPELGEEMVLPPETRVEIDRIAADWRGSRNLRVSVRGHTDSRGIASRTRSRFADNGELSVAKARTVADYVRQAFGIGGEQIDVSGRGSDEPVASNVTAEGRALNRRVELRISGETVTATVRGQADTRLVDPDSGARAEIVDDIADAEERLKRRRRPDRSRRDTTAASPAAGPPPAVESVDALVSIFGADDLVRQTIPIHGGRVRIHGKDVPAGDTLMVDGLPAPVDAQGKFAIEYLLPLGRHQLDVEFADQDGRRIRRPLDVEVDGRSLFLVAIGDLTVSGNDPGGDVQALAGDERFEDDVYVEGRLAFYLKGKIKGKYLITAQLDTGEEEVGDLGDRLDEEDPRRFIRHLDPDRYYPVYGDDSTTIADVNSQGKFYVRVEWDQSMAMWGNFFTGLTGNELAQYNRSLYGAKLQHVSVGRTALGDARTEADVFASPAQTALGHSEFLGTGGSLYYLRHRDIVEGSEKARIEIRERDTNRVVENIALVRDVDYEIDELQGRMLLSRPLSQVTQQFAPSLIKDQPLDGNDVVLLVDYEFVPEGSQMDNTTVGARGKQWLGNHVAVGGTYVDESRDGGEDYQLVGGDLTLKAGPGSYLKAEYSETEASQTTRFLSFDGGLSFDTPNASSTSDRSGEALAVEARANFMELLGTAQPWIAAAWWRDVDAGFSVARRDDGVDVLEYGAELTGKVGRRLDLSARASVQEIDTRENTRASVQGDVRLWQRGRISAEVRYLDEQPLSASAYTATLGALRYTHRLGAGIDVYATGQLTLDDDGGLYTSNDMISVGVRGKVGPSTTVGVEYTDGDRGDAATASIEHALNDRHQIYGTYTLNTDRTDTRAFAEGTRFTLGHRSRFTDQTTVFAENQFTNNDSFSGVAQVFGLDFDPTSAWRFGFTAQTGDLEAATGRIDREAFGFSVGYLGGAIQWNSRLELRNDDLGSEENEQTLTSNRVTWTAAPGLRLNAKLNLADTDASVAGLQVARFIESGLGFAWRPVRADRFNLVGKYTYLYDTPSSAQTNLGPDQRSNIYTLDAVVRLTPHWDLGTKLASRMGELRTGGSDWFEDTVRLGAVRALYHWVDTWDFLVEYRLLDEVDQRRQRSGALAEVSRHFAQRFKLGVGYNFTDFSDDLADVNYDNNGWFVNFVTKY